MKDHDEIVFLLEHDEEFKNYILAVTSKVKMSPDEFIVALESLLEDIKVNPEEYFEAFQTNDQNHH